MSRSQEKAPGEASSESSSLEDYNGQQGDVEAQTKGTYRTASQEGYYAPGLQRSLSNELGGAESVERAFDDDDNDDEGIESYKPSAGSQVKDGELARSQSRRSSVTKFMQDKFGFFDKEIKSQRLSWALSFIRVYVMMIVFMLCVFSIYWGSFYNRTSRYKNLKMLIVNEDNVEIDGIEPLLGPSLTNMTTNPTIASTGSWHVVDLTEFTQQAADNGLTVEEEVQRLVHHQLYWAGIHVRPNATYAYYEALKNANSSFDANGTFVRAYYETGRDLTAMGSYVIPFVKQYQSLWMATLASNFFQSLVEYLSDDEKSNLITSAPALLSTLPTWYMEDMRPSTSSVLIAPYQVGSIYLIIITFFQFNFFVAVHSQVAKHLKKSHFIIYRMLSAQISYFILSLGYSCVSAAFQVNFSLAYKGGFGVYWMISFLTMSAVGGANENVAMVCFSTYPPLLGFWILSWVVLNISPTFSPLALTSVFFRYGYAVPIHNSVEAFKVILFNTYKGQIGRNVGILIVWIAINNAVMPFALKFFASRMKKKAMAEAAAKKGN